VLKRPSYEIKPAQFIVVDKANARMDGGRGGKGDFGGPRGGYDRSAPY